MSHDPWALLREARNSVALEVAAYTAFRVSDADKRVLDLLKRIDTALAAHEAEERVDVDWTLPPSFAVAKARLETIDIRVFEEEAFVEGATGFNVTLTLLKTFATLDEAKSAAIAAARGLR